MLNTAGDIKATINPTSYVCITPTGVHNHTEVVLLAAVAEKAWPDKSATAKHTTRPSAA